MRHCRFIRRRAADAGTLSLSLFFLHFFPFIWNKSSSLWSIERDKRRVNCFFFPSFGRVSKEERDLISVRDHEFSTLFVPLGTRWCRIHTCLLHIYKSSFPNTFWFSPLPSPLFIKARIIHKLIRAGLYNPDRYTFSDAHAPNEQSVTTDEKPI